MLDAFNDNAENDAYKAYYLNKANKGRNVV
jgi:hypothetical protein